MKFKALLLTTALLGTSLATIGISQAHATFDRDLTYYSHLDLSFSAPASSVKTLNYQNFKGQYRSKYSAVGASYSGILGLGLSALNLGLGFDSAINLSYGDLGKNISNNDPNYNKIRGFEFVGGPAAVAVVNFQPRLATYLKVAATYGRLFSSDQTYSTAHHKAGLGVAFSFLHLEAGVIRHKFSGGKYLDFYKKKVGTLYLKSYYLSVGISL